MLRPISLRPSGFQSLLQLLVDPLHHAVALGVVGRGGDVLDHQLLSGGGPDGGGELASPVHGDVGGDAEPGYPVADEGLHAIVDVHGGQGDGLQPPAGPVYDGEQVPEALL